MEPRSPPLPFTASTRAGLAGEGIGEVHLRAGVAAAEVGDAEVGAEKVGAVAEKAERIAGKFFRSGGIPEIRQMR